MIYSFWLVYNFYPYSASILLTWGFLKLSFLCCSVLLLGLLLLELRFGQASCKPPLPWQYWYSAAPVNCNNIQDREKQKRKKEKGSPLLPEGLGAGYPSCQTHQCSNNLQRLKQSCNVDHPFALIYHLTEKNGTEVSYEIRGEKSIWIMSRENWVMYWPWSARTSAPASRAKSPEPPPSLARVTVSPEVVVVLPHTYTPRGAMLEAACSIWQSIIQITAIIEERKYGPDTYNTNNHKNDLCTLHCILTGVSYHSPCKLT